MKSRRLLLAIIGDASVPESDPRYDLAREIGRLGVDAQFRILCGGLGGVMEAACRGAHESAGYREGDTLGLLPGFDPVAANPWVDIAIPTGLEHLRNGLVANADAVIAIGGGAGTLSEIAFAWMLKRPIIAIGDTGWSCKLAGMQLDTRRTNESPAGGIIHPAANAPEAIRLALEYAAAKTRYKGVRSPKPKAVENPPESTD